jgi:4-amino-4-deoxy-L-arabinose transferase-like glycosyltransferase
MGAYMKLNTSRIAILCLASFLLAASIAWAVFEAMPHLEDEFANLYQAKVFASGRLIAQTPDHSKAFSVPFTIDMGGRRFSKYPPGYSLALASGVWIGQPWLVNALAAALGILGVYLLGRDLFGAKTGLLAAALGVISPMYVILSGTLLSHPTTLTALVFFTCAFLRARRPEEPRPAAYSIAAGVLLGWAAITRPLTALGMALPFALLGWSDVIRAPRVALPRYTLMLIPLSLVLSILFLYNHVASGSAWNNLYTLYWEYDAIGFGPHLGTTGDGHSLSEALRNISFSLPRFGVVLLGWPSLAGVPLVGFVLVLGLSWPPRSRTEWALLLPPLGLIAAYMLYWTTNTGLYGTRYYSEAMPFLWILAARALLKMETRKWLRRTIMVALLLVTAWGILFLTFTRILDGRGVYGLTRKDHDVIAAADIHQALIFVSTRDWTDYASLSWLNEPDLSGDLIFAKDMGVIINKEIMAGFLDRSVYYYDPRTGTLSARTEEEGTAFR